MILGDTYRSMRILSQLLHPSVSVASAALARIDCKRFEHYPNHGGWLAFLNGALAVSDDFSHTNSHTHSLMGVPFYSFSDTSFLRTLLVSDYGPQGQDLSSLDRRY